MTMQTCAHSLNRALRKFSLSDLALTDPLNVVIIAHRLILLRASILEKANTQERDFGLAPALQQDGKANNDG